MASLDGRIIDNFHTSFDQSFGYYSFNMMLSQFYNRRSSLDPPKKEEHSQQEEDIINSFYEERKSRSTKNVKQHNLLRKNISYFHKDQEQSPPKPPVQQPLRQPPVLNKNPLKNNEVSIQAVGTNAYLSKPPIPRPSPDINKQAPQPIPPLPLKQLSHNTSQLSSNFSTINLSKIGSQQQDFKAHLKNQLNKRINIQHYLSEISEDNKENPVKPPEASHEKQIKTKLKYNYDASIPQRIPSENVSEQFSRISCNHSGDARPINESRQSSISSFLQDTQNNNFQFSRNSLTDRIQQANQARDQSFSQYRHSVPTLGDSARRSDAGSKKTERQSVGRSPAGNEPAQRESAGRNVLTGDELSELHENSHPIRQEGSESQPTTTKHNLKFFEPQLQAEYKRKVGDLQRELQALKNQHKREDKFIHSIQKMRRLMDGAEEDCSLKELWRWIKQLPQRR